MSASIRTTDKPIFHHHNTLPLAIAYMISKGETTKTNHNSFACIANAHKGTFFGSILFSTSNSA